MNEYDKKYMSKRIDFNSANETEAMMEKQRLGILAQNSDRISAIPRNEAIDSVADFVKEVRAVANRVTIPDFVPLLGDMGVGDLFIGQAPEEIENIAYGNMPFEITPMGDRIPRLKRNRKESFADAALLGVDATAVGVPVAKAASAGVRKAGQVVDQNKELLRPVGSVRMGGGDGEQTNKTVGKQKRLGTTGQYVGAPKGLDSPQKLGSLRRKLKSLAQEGESARFWYERSGEAILDAVGGDKVEAEKLIQAIAITSPQTKVKGNFDFALQSYLQNKAGEPIQTGIFPKAMTKRLEDMYAGVDWEGRKTNNFYVNLMRVIDPEKVQGVTTDLWMMRSFGYNKDVPTTAQYDFVEREVNRLADQLGWEKQQVQAAIWTAAKARKEGTDIATAKFDFNDAIQNNKAQISWESIPSKTSNHIPEIFDSSYEVQQEYHVAISKAFLDDDGYDLIARELGVPSTGEFEAPGYFEGKVSPGTQIEQLLPRQYKGKPWGALEPAGEKLMRVYAATRGLVSKQDGVGVHRPFYDVRKKDANGMEINIGRPFTEEETKELASLLQKYAGHGEYAPIGSRGGVRIINFDYINIPNNKFHNIVLSAVNDIKLNSEVNIERFHAQNALIENDWSKNKNGEDYIRQIRREGQPDIYRKVYSVIKKINARIDDIDQDFSERYGFTRNQELNAEYRRSESNEGQSSEVNQALPDSDQGDINGRE